MAFTCSEKSDLCTGSDGRGADSAVKVTKSIHTYNTVLKRYTNTQSSASEVKIQYIPYSGNFLYKHYIMVKHTVTVNGSTNVYHHRC